MSAVAALLAAVPLCLVGCGQRQPPEPVLVGHVVPLSGADRAAGEQARNGILLAVEETNAPDSLVLGRKVMVEHADTRSDPAAVRGVAVRLLTVSHVNGLLGGRELGDAENLATLARTHATPIVVSSQATSAPGGGVLFYTGLTPQQQGEALARFAINDIHAGPIAALYRAPAGEVDTRAEAFIKGIPADKLLGRWGYTTEDKFKAAVQAVVEKKPAAVMFSGPVEDLLLLGKNGLDEKVPVFFLASEDTQDKLLGAQERRTIYVATVYADDPQLDALQKFVKKYQEQFTAAPARQAVLAYDDARLLFEAMRQASSLEAAKVCEALAKLQFASLTGPVTLSAAGVAQRTVFIVEVQNGKAALKKRYEAETKQARRVTSLAERLAAR
jgi:ABC-type branched-subunit amino acid transport system substrate-binding protein